MAKEKIYQKFPNQLFSSRLNLKVKSWIIPHNETNQSKQKKIKRRKKKSEINFRGKKTTIEA